MAEPARNSFDFSRERAARGLLDGGRERKSMPPRGRDFQDVRSLGYAPSRQALEGRQLVVAKLVALGLADKEIAHYLCISQGTVKGHVSKILRTLGLYRRTQICRYVHEAGLFPQI